MREKPKTIPLSKRLKAALKCIKLKEERYNKLREEVMTNIDAKLYWIHRFNQQCDTVSRLMREKEEDRAKLDWLQARLEDKPKPTPAREGK